MAVNVYGWPPVKAVGHEWDYVSPISESFSALTGKRYASGNGPERRVAQVVVSALAGAGRMGAGYVSVLKRLLDGGSNYVRLTSTPINWYLDALDEQATRASVPLTWASGGVPLLWTSGGIDLLWYTGTILTAVVATSGGFPALTVSGLPINKLVARPGEFITAFQSATDLIGQTVQVMAPAYSNGSGVATVRLYSALSGAYGATPFRVNLGAAETAVFRVIGAMPREVQVVNADWSYGWQFEEVFADEVGGFTEVPAWWVAT